MILQSLVSCYEAMAAREMVSRPGWVKTKVSYAMEVGEDGTLCRVVPLLSPTADGKKQMPRELELPAPVKRTVGVVPNFLWDNAAYLLGVAGKGKPKRIRQCFDAAKTLHLALLAEGDDPFAIAIRRFFEKWDPAAAEDCPALSEQLEEIKKGANLVFLFAGAFPAENAALRRAWQTHYDGEEAGERLPCMVLGEPAVPQPVHPAIKGVQGAQSSGAALVSFNAAAFCSYGREQNFNAPVGKYAAFAYTAALNTLLADRRHVRRFGDTTVVFWAEDAECAYQDAFGDMLDGGSTLSNAELEACMDALSKGDTPNWAGVPLRPDNRFYILGLAPNAARLAVRFFLRDSFGDFVKNIRRHYADIKIADDGRSKFDVIPLWALLRETVNQKSTNKDASPQMAGDTVRAILTGGRYPATLYDQALLRVRAEREVTRGRAGIVKAYLLRNTKKEEYKEAATVALNETCTSVPYVLGRLFSLLENIQDSATGASTVKDRYFNSASATPASAFPLLLKLKNSHMKVLMREKPGLAVTLDRQVADLMDRLGNDFPRHLLLPEQGEFILGYYHQTQKRYEKKDKADSAAAVKEGK